MFLLGVGGSEGFEISQPLTSETEEEVKSQSTFAVH